MHISNGLFFYDAALQPPALDNAMSLSLIMICILSFSAFFILSPVLVVPICFLLLLTILVQHHNVYHLHVRSCETGGLYSLITLRVIGLSFGFQPFLLGLILLSRRKHALGGVLIALGVIIILGSQLYFRWRERRFGLTGGRAFADRDALPDQVKEGLGVLAHYMNGQHQATPQAGTNKTLLGKRKKKEKERDDIPEEEQYLSSEVVPLPPEAGPRENQATNNHEPSVGIFPIPRFRHTSVSSALTPSSVARRRSLASLLEIFNILDGNNGSDSKLSQGIQGPERPVPLPVETIDDYEEGLLASRAHPDAVARIERDLERAAIGLPVLKFKSTSGHTRTKSGRPVSGQAATPPDGDQSEEEEKEGREEALEREREEREMKREMFYSPLLTEGRPVVILPRDPVSKEESEDMRKYWGTLN